METIGGFTVTGRQFRGPASDLVELSAANGLRHTAIVFHPEYRSHSALDIGVIAGFLESPLVTGLSELVYNDPKAGTFVYPTGECWSVAEVIRTLADAGTPDGHIRAGLELMHEAGQILAEAAERGEMDAVYSHGGITPWRVMLKKDGQVEIIGHGLPQIEILQFTQNSSRVPREDSFRYCPPERIERQPESLSSDLFALALVAFELMTGRPVYDGLVVDIQQQAARGEGSRRLFRFRDKLPNRVRELLTRALRPEPDGRFTSGDEFIAEVRSVLSSSEATGVSLMELMGRVASQGSRSGQALESGKTLMVEKDKLRSMLDEADAEDEPRRQAWSAPSRTRREAPRSREEAPAPAAAPAPAPAPEPAAEPESKWSRPTRDRRPAAPAPAPAPPPPSGGTGASSPADILARIRSSAADISPEHAAARERSRQTAQDAVSAILGGAAPVAAPAPEPAPEPPSFTPGRSRRAPRRSSANNIAEMLTQSLANLQHRRPPSAEEVEEQQRALDEAERLQRETREKVEAEAARRRAEEEAARLAAEELARQKAAAEEAALRRALEEEEAAQKKAVEEAAQKKAAADEAARQKKAAEEAAQKKAAEEAAQKKAAEEAAQKKQAAEAAARQKAAAEAAQQQAAAAAAEAAALQQAAVAAEAARKRAEAAEAARKQVAVEALAIAEAARKQAEAEEAARQQAAAELAEAARRQAEEEGRRRAAEAAAEAQRRAMQEVEVQRQELVARVAALEAELAATRAVAEERAEKLYIELATAVREKVTSSTKALVDAEGARWAVVRRAVLSAVEAAASQASERINASLGEGGGDGLASDAAAAVAGALGFSGAETLERPPDVIAVSSGKSGVATFNFQRGQGGRMVRIRLPLDSTTAEAMAYLLGNVLPVRTDLAGRITGWYRLEDEGRRVPASWKLEKLDPQKTYHLQFVQNEVRHADIEVQGAAAPARFVAPVGIAVPAVTLVDHLAAWLELPPGDWGLEMDGRPLAAYEILADVRLGPGLLRLKVGPKT